MEKGDRGSDGLYHRDLVRLNSAVEKLDDAVDRLSSQLPVVADRLDRLMGKVERALLILLGDGTSSGLIARVGRLEDDREDRRWKERALWGAVFGSLASAVAALVATLFSHR